MDQAKLKGEEPRAQAAREAELVAAADRGWKAYYEVAGWGRVALILASTVAIAVFAQHRIRHQDYLIGSLGIFLALFVLSMITSATPWGQRSRVRSDAKGLRKTASRLLRKHRGRLSPAAATEVEAGVAGVDAALSGRAATPVLEARTHLDAVLDEHLASVRKSAAREYTESIGGAIVVALLLRAFVFEPFHIPSGSMIPTLLVGDFIFVNKMGYGLRIPFTDPATVAKVGQRMPQRGDVIVFTVPSTGQDYVKRVIGLPGDTISVRENVLYINGVEQERTYVGEYTYTEHSDYTDSDVTITAKEYVEDLAGRKHRIITRQDPVFQRSGTYVVEPGRVFVMGDNRDNSADSRVAGGIGQIPISYVKGNATIIWISFGGDAGIRFDRMFQSVQ